MRTTTTILLLLAILPLLTACSESPPPDHLFDVRLGMPQDEVNGLLGRTHRLALEESGVRGAKQFWELEDESYRSLAVAYDGDRRVKYITAHGRPDGRPVRYRDLGDLEQATLTGKYFYMWNAQTSDAAKPYAIVARGTDPQILLSVSLYTPLIGQAPRTPAVATP